MLADLSIRALDASETSICEAILRRLPEWFGIEASLLQYVADAGRYPTTLALVGAQPAGFLTLHTHFPEAAEVHCIAVAPEFHNQGIGRALLAEAEPKLRTAGVKFLQVKTLGPSRPDANYDRTRSFYRAAGFTPVEEFLTLWPGNPCLLMIKTLG